MTVKTAAEYREQANASSRRSAESWERSDTDGFLSQWASDRMASVYLNNAAKVEAGGFETRVVVDIETGRVAATMDDQREGQYGYYFYITDAQIAARNGRYFSESNARSEVTRERNNAKKGFRIETRWVPLADCFESRSTSRIEADLSTLKG
jgi:hypothetical protein